MLRASLVVQGLSICLPVQGTQVQSLVGELRAHMPWNSSARAPQLLNANASATEVCMPRAHALQQEKPPQ